MIKKECAYGYYEKDDSQILRFTVTKGEPTIEELDEFQKLNIEIMNSYDKPFVIAFDASNAKWLSSDARIKMGKQNKDVEEMFKDLWKKSFLIIPNPILKMMLKGVNLVAKPTIPQVVVSSMDEAVKKAKEEVASW